MNTAPKVVQRVWVSLKSQALFLPDLSEFDVHGILRQTTRREFIIVEKVDEKKTQKHWPEGISTEPIDHIAPWTHDSATDASLLGVVRRGSLTAVPCPHCKSHKQVNCEQCKASGMIQCNACSGHGNRRCSSCDGEGQITTERSMKIRCDHRNRPDFPFWAPCPDCDDRGWLLTNKTEGGVILDRRIPYERTETITDVCTNCGGTGRIDCGKCHATGEIGCHRCHTTGKETCHHCGPDGHIYEFIERSFQERQVFVGEPQTKDFLPQGHGLNSTYFNEGGRKTEKPLRVENDRQGKTPSPLYYERVMHTTQYEVRDKTTQEVYLTVFTKDSKRSAYTILHKLPPNLGWTPDHEKQRLHKVAGYYAGAAVLFALALGSFFAVKDIITGLFMLVPAGFLIRAGRKREPNLSLVVRSFFNTKGCAQHDNETLFACNRCQAPLCPDCLADSFFCPHCSRLPVTTVNAYMLDDMILAANVPKPKPRPQGPAPGRTVTGVAQ